MSINDKTIIRTVKKSQYVTINNSVFTDKRLSWKAKGIMGYLLSRPDDWKVIVGDLIKQSKDGKDAVYTGLKELKKYGYVEQRTIRREDGKKSILRWEYIVYEEPIQKREEPLTENPEVDLIHTDYLLTENPEVDNPEMDNPTLLNTECTNDLIKPNTKNKQIEPNVLVPVVVNIDFFSIREDLKQLSIKVSDQELTQWISKHDATYVLEKIKVVKGMTSTAPLRTLRAAIKDNWKVNYDNSNKNDSKGNSEHLERVVPAVQAGKYERFYQVYGKTAQHKAT